MRNHDSQSAPDKLRSSELQLPRRSALLGRRSSPIPAMEASQWWAYALSLPLVCACIIAGVVEWEHYRGMFGWQKLGLSNSDQAGLLSILVGKSLVVLLPIVCGSALLYWVGRQRLGWWSLTCGITAVAFWLVVDVRVRTTTGNHVFDYLPFLLEPASWEWAGQEAELVLPGLVLFAGCMGVVMMIAWALTRITRSLSLTAARRTVWLGGGSMLATALVGLTSPSWFSHTALLERFHESLPVVFLPRGQSSSDIARFGHQLSRSLESSYREILPQGIAAQPLDELARVRSDQKPNIILIVLESFRFDSLDPGTMPNLSQLRRQSLVLKRHYAASNGSHWSLFSLLYGRLAIAYDVTLDAKIRPQLTATLRRSGYQCSYLAGHRFPYLRMEEFINNETFDYLHLEPRGDFSRRDRLVLQRVERLARRKTPQFMLAFLMSTHHDYRYPPEFEVHKPVVEKISLLNPNLRDYREHILNRYRNAAGYLDHEIGALIESLDPEKNLVVITGDHGESVFDDGHMFHASKLSEIQTRVPCLLWGKNITADKIAVATTHVDLLETILHAASGKATPIGNSHGRDLIESRQPVAQIIAQVQSPHATETDALIMRGNQRLLVRLRLDRPSVRLLYPCDTMARFDPHQSPELNQVPAWTGVFSQHLSEFLSSGIPDRQTASQPNATQR